MKITLHKIVMPFTVSDYERGFLYTLAYIAKQETGKGSGVELVSSKNDKEFKLPDNEVPEKCQYTHKIYHCERFVSNWVRKIAIKMFGKNSLKFIEHAWNCYPYMYTSTENMEKPEKIAMHFESYHIDNDKGNTEKPKFIHNSKHLKNKNSFKGVQIRVTDITENMKKLKKFDPTKTESKKAGVGPLTPSTKKKPWHDSFDGPTMCCYKLSNTKFDITFGGTLEGKFVKQQDFALKKFHKMIYCLMDEWWDMTLEEVLKYEEEVNKELGNNLHREDIELTGGGFGAEDASSRADSGAADQSENRADNSGAQPEKATPEGTNETPSGSVIRSDAKGSEPKAEEKPATSESAVPPASEGIKTKKLTPNKSKEGGESFKTPDQELPPMCDECSVRHKPGDPHRTKKT